MERISREMLYVSDDGAVGTFELDESLPTLPLPKLESTLNRYYESLRPFGNEQQLKVSRKIIEEFKNGVGIKLQKILEERAKAQKNWVEKWWEDYAYCIERTPIYPYNVMSGAVPFEGIQFTVANSLKILSRVMYHNIEYWNLVHKERLRPITNPSGSITFSSAMQKRLFSTSRLPGETMDHIQCHFKTASEGRTPSYYIAIGKGHLFKVNVLNDNGTLVTPQQLLVIHRRIRDIIEERKVEHPVAVLTCTNRTAWAANRKYLNDLSQNNADILDIIAKAMWVLSLDENSPGNESETCSFNVGGDFYSKWADNSYGMIFYKNGRMSSFGEHSCFDGSISASIQYWMVLSMIQEPEPDWDDLSNSASYPVELKFHLDDHLVKKIKSAYQEVEKTKNILIVSMTHFTGYGKRFMKSHRLHPDAYIQMLLQLTHYKMHNDFVATYETALMRSYYNGRTETVRSCSMDAIKWAKTFVDPSESDENKIKFLLNAINTQNNLMEAARNGNGVDRHLFGLWCAAYEAKIPLPALYEDELYIKSGGGGNFLLSTSSLGYTGMTGFFPPMCPDGYASFYSITNDVVLLTVSAFRESDKTNADRFAECFERNMLEVREMIERVASLKIEKARK